MKPDGLHAAERDELDASAALLRGVFVGVEKFSRAFLDWQYYANPVGPPLGCNLFEQGRLVGHLMGIPIEVTLGGAPCVVTLILNSALTPATRGGGRFSAMVEWVARMSCERGHAGVIGVANAQSFPAYVRRLGFQDVGALDAWLELAPHGLDVAAAQSRAQFARRWRDETLAWRLANPANPLRIVAARAEQLIIEGRSSLPGITARAVIPRDSVTLAASARAARGPAVALGLAPPGTRRRRLSWNIPARLRPSPLRLVWLAHRDPPDALAADRMLFGLLDFDAF